MDLVELRRDGGDVSRLDDLKQVRNVLLRR